MLAISLLNTLLSKNESFANTDEKSSDGIKSFYLYIQGYNAKYYYKWGVTDFIFLAVFYISAFMVSVYSAYLSYTCTWRKSVTNKPIRILIAFFAFMLGPLYLLWYFLINYMGGLC